MRTYICWTGADREIKNALREKLGAAGIDCWDSDKECTSDYSSECISNIHKSGLFIVIVSDASMENGYMINEVIEARKLEGEGKLDILIYKPAGVAYTSPFEILLNHICAESDMDILARRAVMCLTARQ